MLKDIFYLLILLPLQHLWRTCDICCVPAIVEVFICCGGQSLSKQGFISIFSWKTISGSLPCIVHWTTSSQEWCCFQGIIFSPDTSFMTFLLQLLWLALFLNYYVKITGRICWTCQGCWEDFTGKNKWTQVLLHVDSLCCNNTW